jgi:AraC-like DNA-binding protein
VRRHFGTTTTGLVNDLRLEHAARLLSLTDQPIVDVAHASGFDHLSYFYRRFTTRYGRTPRRYRQQARRPGPA